MIRLMKDSDKNEYFEMSRAFYSSGAALEEIPNESRKSFWQEIMSARYIKGYIIESTGEVAGYALAFIYASQEAGGKVMFIDELFVKEKFRGKGLGKEFFAYAEKVDGISAFRLEAENDNLRAIRLYKSLGYERLDYMQMIKHVKRG